LISLISGAAGGNIVGSLAKKLDLGVAGNSVAGILGGGLGQWLIGLLGVGGAAAAGSSGSGLDIGSILGSIASGGAGGGVLMAIIGAIKNAMNKS
jgi:hypothetical protein